MSRDAWLVLGMCFLLVFAFAYAGLYWWAAFMLAFTVLLGVFEWLALKITGKTLSQQFGEFRAKHRWKADALLLLLVAAVLGLVLHLIAMTPR